MHCRLPWHGSGLILTRHMTKQGTLTAPSAQVLSPVMLGECMRHLTHIAGRQAHVDSQRYGGDNADGEGEKVEGSSKAAGCAAAASCDPPTRRPGRCSVRPHWARALLSATLLGSGAAQCDPIRLGRCAPAAGFAYCSLVGGKSTA